VRGRPATNLGYERGCRSPREEEVEMDENLTDNVYETPEVRTYGSLVDLTEGTGGGQYEDGSTKSAHPSAPTSP
jgi:hypothetical protein